MLVDEAQTGGVSHVTQLHTRRLERGFLENGPKRREVSATQ